MADTVKGLPEVEIDHFAMSEIEDAFIDGVERKKKLLKGRSTLKETKLIVGDIIRNEVGRVVLDSLF